MKKLLKKLGLILTTVAIAVTTIVGLTACAGNDGKDSDYLYVATNAEFPPFEYLENGKPAGFDIDFADALAKEMGYKGAKVVDMKFEGIVGSIQAGKTDVGIAGLTIDPEKEVSFSKAYYETAQVVIYKGEAKTFASEEELQKFLNGKKVGVCLGYSGDKLLKGYIADKVVTGVTPVVTDNGIMAVENLKNGKVDVVIIDKAPATKIVENAKDPSLKITEQTLGQEKYGVACKKGNTELVNKVNAAIDSLMKKDEATGKSKYDVIFEKYFKMDK